MTGKTRRTPIVAHDRVVALVFFFSSYLSFCFVDGHSVPAARAAIWREVPRFWSAKLNLTNLLFSSPWLG